MNDKSNSLSNHYHDERRYFFGLQSRIDKVDKAVQFLASPDIQDITTDATKAEFLKTRGLNPSEIREAFRRYYLNSESSAQQLSLPRLLLQPIAGEYSKDSTVGLVQSTPSSNGLSKFFTFCQRLVLLAGIASTMYYAFEKWARARDTKKKTEKTVKDELNQIRNELTKISNELRKYQLMERNQANLLTEINSLKAILVGRQFFDEKPSKVSLPSWQLSGKPVSKVADKVVTDSSAEHEGPLWTTVPSHQTNGLATSPSKVKSDESIPVKVSVLVDDSCEGGVISQPNGVVDHEVLSLSNGVDAEEAKKGAPRSNGVENTSRSKKTATDKKN